MASEKLILVVSQHDGHRALYEIELENAGYSVVTAHSGHSAKTEIERTGAAGIDLIVMGSRRLVEIELLEKAIVSLGENAPPVIISSSSPHAEQEYHGTPLEPYIRAYAIKSGNVAPLIEKVRDMIGAPKMQYTQ